VHSDGHISRHRQRAAAGPCLLARTAAVVATGCLVLHLVSGTRHRSVDHRNNRSRVRM